MVIVLVVALKIIINTESLETLFSLTQTNEHRNFLKSVQNVSTGPLALPLPRRLAFALVLASHCLLGSRAPLRLIIRSLLSSWAVEHFVLNRAIPCSFKYPSGG